MQTTLAPARRARSRAAFIAMALAAGLASTSALAQIPSAAPVWAASGYRGAAQIAQQPFATAAGSPNTMVVNGELVAQGPASALSQFEALSGGAAMSIGAGGSTVTAVGNSLNITVNGSGNTVVVSSQQTNTSEISATGRN